MKKIKKGPMENYILDKDGVLKKINIEDFNTDELEVCLSGIDNSSIYSDGGKFVGILKRIEGILFLVCGNRKKTFISLKDIKIESIRNIDGNIVFFPRLELINLNLKGQLISSKQREIQAKQTGVFINKIVIVWKKETL